MRRSTGFRILMAVTWPMQLFPLEFHYVVSDFLCFFIHLIFGYRRQTVRKNLTSAFPEKDKKEIRSIERAFYRNFTDIFIETLYIAHINYKKNAHRLVVHNSELIDQLYDEKRNIIGIAGHFGNWEFANLFTPKFRHKLFVVYKKLSNSAFDQFFMHTRSHLGAFPLEMRETVKRLLLDSRSDTPYFAYLIADQRPQHSEHSFWMPFLNNDTPVLTGPEKIAKKINAAVLWLEVRRVKRGHYEIHLELITKDPRSTADNEISTTFMKHLEKAIIERPDQWLWSHKRWKHKRE